MFVPGLNTAFALSGARLDPYHGYNFLVEIDGLLVGGFREVRGLEGSIEVKEYAEGGLNRYSHKFPGEVKYPNLVLSRGLTDIDTMWGWFDDVARGIIKRRNITIMLLDARRLPAMWWDVKAAFPVKWMGPSLDATRGGEVATEGIELAHRGIKKPTAARVLSAVRAAAQIKR